jgi:voltage-gated potassium channel
VSSGTPDVLAAGRRLRICVIGVLSTLTVGTAGFALLGLSWLNALYHTVTTVTTVGYEPPFAHPSSGQRLFTIFIILAGVSMVAYTFSVMIEVFVEGQLRDVVGRRRMERRIEAMKDHVIICGWGRVGRVIARYVANSGNEVVVIDQDPDRLATVPHPALLGDATDESVLRSAGLERARVLIVALSNDAGNVYVTLTGRALRPDLFVIARARTEAAENRLLQAGANRVVNPQGIGGARMAAFALQPHVAEFLDVVMHDGSLEFRLEEISVPGDSPLVGKTLREAEIRERTGALVLALRNADGQFTLNPGADVRIASGHILIAIGTVDQLEALTQEAIP